MQATTGTEVVHLGALERVRPTSTIHTWWRVAAEHGATTSTPAPVTSVLTMSEVTVRDAVPADAEVTHAGTGSRADGAIVTAGGRVLNVTALGDGPAAARDAAYAAADLITFEGRQLRRDIALRAVERT